MTCPIKVDRHYIFPPPIIKSTPKEPQPIQNDISPSTCYIVFNHDIPLRVYTTEEMAKLHVRDLKHEQTDPRSFFYYRPIPIYSSQECGVPNQS